MKKSGMQSRVEKVSITTEKRGMTFMESPTFFMMIPPASMPTATEGRFTAPEEHQGLCFLQNVKRKSLLCQTELHIRPNLPTSRLA